DDAIHVNKTAEIDINKCRGCNLCVLKCPQNAIRLNNEEKYERLFEKYKNLDQGYLIKNFMNKEKVGLLDNLNLYRKLKKWRLL
ncbi:MAG: 4Fe-4S binding protein, partial [Candidatus Hermodarchaeota archaeon]